jgi:O-antigen/teichoic acid export membrane protein
MLSALVLFAFNGIFSPIISSLYRRNFMEDLSRLYQDVSRWVFTGAFAIFLITMLLGRDILEILGPQFVSGWVVLVAIALAQLFNSSVGPTQRILAMTRHQTVLMMATAGSAVIGVAANFILVPMYGVLGAGIATAAAIFLMNAISLLAVRRLLGFWPYSREYVRPIAAGTLAAIGVYLAKLEFPFSSPIPTVLVFGSLFLALFVIFLLAVGLTPSDRKFLTPLWETVQQGATRLRVRAARGS